jgi:bifunctional enzyme CysN/CysC|tara:strand:- start:227 stop:1159 length:933 start_codon:yes stop_codon:yes gene_type:complete
MSKHTKQKTALIIGRWQPWHKGHRGLFEAALERAERVAIGVRHTHASDGKNPFTFDEVKDFIDKDLKENYSGKYDVIDLPNITNVIYGRDVGYKVEKISLGEDIEKISATQVRKSMNLTPVSHDVEIHERTKRFGHEGGVLWFTGLSGSGKSTLARALERKLFNKGYNVYMLDADNVRNGLNSNLGFSADDRNENIRRVGEVAALFSQAGFIVLSAFISPFNDERKKVSEMYSQNFHQVYLSADLNTCEERDPKGLYKKARLGEIKDFTGIDSPYEVPTKSDLVIDTEKLNIEDSVEELFTYVINKMPIQ